MSATEAEAERAIAALKLMIEAAENSNQAGEDAVVVAAAAPDLLSACQRAHRVIKAMTGNQEATSGNVIGQLERAIAKAQGGAA